MHYKQIQVAMILSRDPQSLKGVVGETWYQTEKEQSKFPVKVLFIEEPQRKLYKAYCYLESLETDCPLPPRAMINWAAFVDYVLDENPELFAPQMSSDLAQDGFDYLIQLESINMFWPNFTPDCNEAVRRAPAQRTSTYRQDEIAAKYIADQMAWESAKSYSGESGWHLV